MPMTSRHDAEDRGRPARDVRVVTVDDHPIFLDVTRTLLEVTPGFEPVGEASSGEEALELVRRVDPDLVLLDVRMAGLDGIETARSLRAEHDATVIVLLSSGDIGALGPMAQSCGATAFVRKQDLDSRLLRGLWASHLTGSPAVTPRRAR